MYSAGRKDGDSHIRALFYSHDTLGLGHLRRTLTICQGLGASVGDTTMLVITGSAFAHGVRLPEGVDYVKLPSVTKVDRESYDSRSVKIPFQSTLRLREEIIFHTTAGYRPDLFFVDNVPMGMKGELVKTLRHVRANMPETRVLLTLRDILDDRSHIVPQWRRTGVFDAPDRYYDRILVYGLPEVFDLVNEYELPENVRRKTCFSGYLPRPADWAAAREVRRGLCPGGGDLVLVTVGGGADGAPVVQNYLQSAPLIHGRKPVTSLVVLGPDMDCAMAHRLKRSAPPGPIHFLDSCEDLTVYIAAADAVVSMAGYNTISEILSLRKKAVVVPRVRPRTEQLIRAQRLQELGLARMIHPEQLTPSRMACEVLQCLESPGEPPPKIRFTGLETLSREISAILADRSHSASAAAASGALQ